MTEIELKVKALTEDWYLVGVAQAQSSPRAVELSETAGNLAKRIMREIILPMQDELSTSDAWHASYCRVQDENTDLKQMLATEIAATVALRTELAAANAKVAELTDKLRSEGYDV